MGGRWTTGWQPVHQRLGELLRKNLSSNDFFAPIDPDHFIVVSPNETAEHAAIICVTVAHQLLSSVVGKVEIDFLKVCRAASGPDGTIDATPFTQREVLTFAAKSDIFDHLQADKKQQAATGETEKAGCNELFEIDYQYEPIWDARHEAVTTYLCNRASVKAIGRSSEPVRVTDLPQKEQTIVELSVLSAGISQLVANLKTEDRFLLGLPLSFELLGAPQVRMEVARRCRSFSSVLRQYLTFFITDVPAGVAPSRLSDLAVILRPFGRVVANVPVGCRIDFPYLCAGLSGIFMDAGKSVLSAETLKNEIVHLGAMARNCRLNSYLLGLDKPEVLTVARAAEIQMLSGPAIAPARKMPRRMTSLPWSALLPGADVAGEEEWF